MTTIGTRQVHLDFHTSEHIPDVGLRFDRKQWQRALKKGRVETINIFAKCHHGWSYYPTRIGQAHPNLRRPDLLGEQIAACHDIGVKAPIYFTVGWSVHDAETHPEWTLRDRRGRPLAFNDPQPRPGPDAPRPFCSWTFLCPRGRYLDLIRAQTIEICERYPHADGLWYDITGYPWGPEGPVCYCAGCRRGMRAEGIDLDDTPAVEAFGARKWRHFFDVTKTAVQTRLGADAVVYYNGTTMIHARQTLWAHNTEQDLEDLPTTWGGYDKFPLRARYFARQDRPMVAMSGKFHTSWGEFGGFKHPDAIRFEAAAMIAFGARVNFGDQLHPSGEMDPATYDHIGTAFAYVERIAPYGLDGRPAASLGLWWGQAGASSTGAFAAEPNHQGVASMLLESQIDFEVVDEDDALERFAVIVLTGAACLGPRQVRRLEAYRRRGGKLLVLGEGGLDAATRKRFALAVGALYIGPSNYKMDYLRVAAGPLGGAVVASPFVCPVAGLRARLRGARALAAIREPYFDRTYATYCSHMNTPYRVADAPHPGAWALKDLVYLAHPVGYLYGADGARLHRQYFLNALRMLYPERRQILAAGLPSGGRVSLVHQPDQRRYCAHLLYGPPMSRGRCQIIEDLVPLADVPVALRTPHQIRRVHLPVEALTLRPRRAAGAVRVTLPRLQGHTVVVFEY